MSLSTKILGSIIAILLIAFGGMVIYLEVQHRKEINALNQNLATQQELLNGIVRSSATTVSQNDLTTFAKQNDLDLATIQSNLDSLGAKLDGINKITVVSTGQQATNVPSTSSVVDNTAPPLQPGEVDQFGYLTHTQNLQLNENFAGTQVPIGSVGFSAWKSSPWDLTILPRSYSVISTIGSDADGKKYVYNKMTIKSGDQSYTLPIQTAQFEETLPSASFSLFNPRLFLGVAAGLDVSQSPLESKITPNIGLDFMSYGKTKTSPSLSFAGIGLGPGFEPNNGKVSAEVMITPIRINLGKDNGLGIPLINNTYLSPSLQISNKGDITPSIGIAVGL